MIIASKRWRVARAVGGEAWVRGAAFVFPTDSVSQRARPARAVGGEAWVRGAPFVFPIDHLGPFSGLARARPARAVDGEAWVRGASFLFPIDSLESFRHFQRINARSRAWASWDVASAIRSTEAMTAYSPAIKNAVP